MARDLFGTTWQFNSNPSVYPSSGSVNIGINGTISDGANTVTSDSTYSVVRYLQYTRVGFFAKTDGELSPNNFVYNYDYSDWLYNGTHCSAPTFNITSHTTDLDTFVDWLEDNATEIIEPSSNHVFVGGETVDAVMVGDTQVDKLYLGANEIWTASQTYTITPTLTHVTGSAGNPTTITQGGTATLTYTADSGYTLPASVSVTGATGTWTQATGTLVLSNPTGNVSFAIAGEQQGNYLLTSTGDILQTTSGDNLEYAV